MSKHPAIEPVSKDDYIRALMYGNPSAGKTSLIGSGADEYKTLIIRPPLDHIPARVLGTKAEQWIVRTWEDMDEVMQFYRHEGDQYDWIWLDSISGWQDQGLDDIWYATVELFPHRADKTIKGGLDRGEYGRNMERIGQWVRHIVGSNMSHVGITAWPFLTDNPFSDNAAEMQYWPWVQGKGMPQRIAGYMNLVGYLEVREAGDGVSYRRMHTQYSARAYAKDQFDAFPKGYVDNPTLPGIVKAIEAAMAGKSVSQTSRRGRAAATTTATPRGRGRSK